METIGNPWLWGGFFVLVLTIIAIDLFVMGGRKAHIVSAKEAMIWTLVWVVVTLAFCAGLWVYLDANQGREIANAKAGEFLTGYLIEQSLSVDNVFLWLMLFSYFGIPPQYQRRVLLLGVLGAIVMRTLMIVAGAYLLAKFHWILYVFGVFLLITGIKMAWFAEHTPDISKNPVLLVMRRFIRITDDLHGEKFWVWQNGVRWFTPLLLVLVLVEVTDLVFAIDSIPAIFAITTDPFIVLTSNVFAIMGLRAMYFLLAGVGDRFSLLRYGLAVVLIFIGVKMLLLEIYKIPTLWSLLFVAVVIGISMIASLYVSRSSVVRKSRP